MPVATSSPLPPKAQEAKDKGNAAFTKADYPSAVGAYTDALLTCSTSAVSDSLQAPLYLNRSLAYLKLNKYEDAERDASAALKRDESTKAFYRRGAARSGALKFKEALRDFQAALKLDPKNTEAANALKAVQAELAKQTAPRKAPLDLPAASSASKAPSPAAAVPQLTSSSAAQTSEQSGGRSGSSVEAARLFLEKVGMSDPVPAPTSTSSSAHKSKSGTLAGSASEKEVLPDRFPGESGGMLREVSTRRLAPSSVSGATEQQATSSTPASDSISASQPSNGATRTASALSFGSAPAARSTAGTYSAPRAASSTRLSAYEFDRQWREASRSGADEATRRQREWQFLRSQDLSLLPSTLGALLEPDLLASLLSSFRALLTSSRATESAEEVRSHIAACVNALPSCARFGTAVAFLDSKEREDAKTVLDELEGKACLAEGVRARWSM